MTTEKLLQVYKRLLYGDNVAVAALSAASQRIQRFPGANIRLLGLDLKVIDHLLSAPNLQGEILRACLLILSQRDSLTEPAGIINVLPDRCL